MKKVIAIVLLLGAGAAFIWVWLAVSVTLSGSDERASIGNDPVAYVVMFLKYAAFPGIGAIGLWFWGAVVAVILAFFLIRSR